MLKGATTNGRGQDHGGRDRKRGGKKSENIVELARPYGFEGKEYGEIDLTGLEKLTVQDAIDVQRQLFGEGEAAASVLCETTTAFARAMAVKATGMPIEFSS